MCQTESTVVVHRISGVHANDKDNQTWSAMFASSHWRSSHSPTVGLQKKYKKIHFGFCELSAFSADKTSKKQWPSGCCTSKTALSWCAEVTAESWEQLQHLEQPLCLPFYNFSHSIFDALIHLKALTQNKGSPDTQTSKQNQHTHTNAYKTWILFRFF